MYMCESYVYVYRCATTLLFSAHNRPTQRFTHIKGWLVDLPGAESECKKQHR